MNRNFLVWIFLFILCFGSVLALGETPWLIVLDGFFNRVNGVSNDWNPLLDERLPRAIVLACSGASLAVSGAVMQALFRNPLAAPNVLGITAGGSLLTVCLLIMGLHISYPFLIPAAAVVGCLATLFIVYLIAGRSGTVDMSHLILTGIAVSTILIAAQSALLFALKDNWQLMQTISEWEAGSTIDRSWQHVHMQLPLTLVGLWGCFSYRQELNLLALGDEEAANLGVDVSKVRWRLFLCIALLAGGALAGVGIVAFFGLILPHMMRQFYGNHHAVLIPMCLIAGSVALMFLDITIRLLGVQMFTIGNISAILGGAFFLSLITNRAKRYATV